MSCHVVLADRPLIDPDVAISGHVDLPGTPDAAPEARRFVRAFLAGLPEDVIGNVELLTSELVTNVVIHAQSPVHVGLSRDMHNVLVVVQDFSNKTSAQRVDHSAEGLAETGRGMAIVASLADDFGWKRRPGEVGKIMWFAVGLAKPAPPALHLG